MEKMKNHFQLKNSYSHADRISFSISINKCVNSTSQVCEPDEKIEEMLHSMFFTIYTIQETINFHNGSNYGGNPIVVSDKFFA